MDEDKQMVTAPQGALVPVLDAGQVAKQLAVIQDVMSNVMQEDTHYGKIPGCGNKPTLLQPGAQVLGVTFQLYGDIEEHQVIRLEGGHIEVHYRLAIVSRVTGKKVAIGVGSASTMESKHRWRRGEKKVVWTDDPIPDDYRENKAAYNAKGEGCKKNDQGEWKWVRFEGSDEKVESNPYDVINTVEKIAYKRAYVHGMINSTGCSDIFTQDLEDLREVLTNDHIDVSPPAYVEPVPKAPVETKQEAAPEKEPPKPVAKEEPPKPAEAEETAECTREEADADPANQHHSNEAEEQEEPPAEDPLDEGSRNKVLAYFLKLSKSYNQKYIEDFMKKPFEEMTPTDRLKLKDLLVKLRKRRSGEK